MVIQIRWLIRRDMPAVLEIEQASFEFPWTDEDFSTALRNRNCIGMVAEYDRKILGFMVYELHKTQLRILNFAVHPEYRRQMAGAQMVGRLIEKLSLQRRTEIMFEIRERNLDAQLFFRACGFEAISVLRNCYDDTGEDGYIMRFRLPGQDTYVGTNRISAHISPD